MKFITIVFAALLLSGCASVYKYNAQTGELYVKSRKSVGEVNVTRNKDTGEFTLTVKGAYDPVNEGIGEILKQSLPGGGQ